MLKKIEKPKTLKESALEQLRNAIMLGTFAPGERLMERDLCKKMAVSRTVIRECIRHLESERLLVVHPHIGPVVAELSIEEVTEIYEIRAQFESAAIKECAKLASEETIAKLEQLIERISTALSASESIEVIEYTREFYETIFQTSQKNVSWDIVNMLNSRISRLRVLTLSSKNRRKTGPEHLKSIVKAIKAKDIKAAELACRNHIKEASAIGIELLKQS